MRPDMFEVIIERPRHRWGKRSRVRPAYREGDRFRRDPELARRCEAMRLWTGPRWLNENLAPLRRFLQSRVGRAWNEVHAEIAAQLAPSSAVQKHVLDHLAQLVTTHTCLVDGDVWGAHWRGRFMPVGRGFYVCPNTGVLANCRRVRHRRLLGWIDPDRLRLDGQRELRAVRGVWELVQHRWARARRPYAVDPAVRVRLGPTLAGQLEAYHTRPRWVRVEHLRREVTADEFARLARGAPPRPAA